MLLNKNVALCGAAMMLVACSGAASAQTASPLATVTNTISDAVDTVVTGVQSLFTPTTTTTSGVTLTPVASNNPSTVTPVTTPDPVPTPVLTGNGVAKVFEVRTPSELRTALVESLKLAGAEIRIHPGKYGTLTWSSRKHTLGRVRLVAATSVKPQFDVVSFASSQGIALHGVEISGSASVLMNLSGANDVVVSNVLFTSAANNRDPWDNGNTAIHIRNAKNVSVTDSTIEDLRLAMYIQRSSNVKVRNNTIQFMREGLNVAATDGLLLERNYFTDFYPNYAKGEHPDTVQFWTTNEEVGVTNAKLIENVMLHGGCRAVQGLFLGNERSIPAARHKNLEVRGNVYYGASVHGISVSRTDGLKMSNNVVVSSPWADRNNSVRSADGKCSGGYAPRIRSTETTGTEAWNNIGMATPQIDSGNKWDNWDVVDAAYGGLPWTDLFTARPTADVPALSAFVTKNPSLARTRNAGILTAFPAGARAGATLSAALAAHAA